MMDGRRRPRQPYHKNEARNYRHMTVRVTERMHAEADRYAAYYGVTLSEFVRQALEHELVRLGHEGNLD